ncbi:MAG: hypothetical protein M3460_27695 [Actinomycetota bacterium]|nr:hypothetical protein [Actinomycetota bacterium]
MLASAFACSVAAGGAVFVLSALLVGWGQFEFIGMRGSNANGWLLVLLIANGEQEVIATKMSRVTVRLKLVNDLISELHLSLFSVFGVFFDQESLALRWVELLIEINDGSTDRENVGVKIKIFDPKLSQLPPS